MIYIQDILQWGGTEAYPRGESRMWSQVLAGTQIELAANYGFGSKDLKKITELVEKYGDNFKQQFAAHIGKRVDD